MNKHFQHVAAVLSELKPGAVQRDASVLVEVRRAAEEANRIRFREQLRLRGEARPFRRGTQSREQRIADIRRFAGLAAHTHGRDPRSGEPRPSPLPAPAPVPAGCDPGWSSVLREGDMQYPGGSSPVLRPAAQSLPPDENGGYSGISALSTVEGDQLSLGAVIGDFCDLSFTPPDQRIQMGAYEGAAISASTFTFYDLDSPLSERAPDALMAKASVLRTQAANYMVAGDPAGPGGGLVWCYATATLDVYVGLNITGIGGPLPHASAQACLWNRMGSPYPPDPNVNNNVNGDWLTRIDVFDDGEFSNPTLTASIGGTRLPDQILLAVVSVNIACLRYPGDSGFVGVLFDSPGSQLITGPDIFAPDTAPIQVQGISLCGI